MRRVGLLSGGAIVADSFDEMTLAFDLAVLGTQPGRSRAIDRYARAHPPTPGSDEAVTLDALRHCRFRIIRVLRRHEIAGLVVEDIVSHEELWLMDEGLEATAPEGAAFGTRLLRLNGFYMTAGAAVPVTGDVLEAAIASRPVWLNDAQFRFVDGPSIRGRRAGRPADRGRCFEPVAAGQILQGQPRHRVDGNTVGGTV